MEVIFTWHNTDDEKDLLDIRILKPIRNGGTLVGTTVVEKLRLAHSGLAQNVFYQFVHPDDPVSKAAKASFASRFYSMMQNT